LEIQRLSDLALMYNRYNV